MRVLLFVPNQAAPCTTQPHPAAMLKLSPLCPCLSPAKHLPRACLEYGCMPRCPACAHASLTVSPPPHRLGAIPIVNENDTVAVQELRIGDNDTLSAQVGPQLNWLASEVWQSRAGKRGVATLVGVGKRGWETKGWQTHRKPRVLPSTVLREQMA